MTLPRIIKAAGELVAVAIVAATFTAMLIYGLCLEADRQSRIKYDPELGRMVYHEKGV